MKVSVLDNTSYSMPHAIYSTSRAYLFLLFFSALKIVADPFTSEELAFFEKRVRPVLVAHCFECHSEKTTGGLRLDSRERLVLGGDSGAAAIEGDSEASLLIQAIEYGADSNQMPPKKKHRIFNIDAEKESVDSDQLKDMYPSDKKGINSHRLNDKKDLMSRLLNDLTAFRREETRKRQKTLGTQASSPKQYKNFLTINREKFEKKGNTTQNRRKYLRYDIDRDLS